MNRITRYIKAKLQARKNRRNAIRMMVYAGVLRHSGHGIRYGMSEREIRSLVAEENV